MHHLAKCPVCALAFQPIFTTNSHTRYCGCFVKYKQVTFTVPPQLLCNFYCICTFKRFRWSRGSVLAFSTQVRGFKPGRSLRIFKGEKILRAEVKPSVPCRRFAACKRSLNGVEVVISAILPDNILAHSSTFRR